MYLCVLYIDHVCYGTIIALGLCVLLHVGPPM